MTDFRRGPIVTENAEGRGRFVVLCDHASNRIPDDYESFGFEDGALLTHIAWDPGALPVARFLSAGLDAPLVWPDASRLIVDCNRPPDSETLIVTVSEGRAVEANRDLGAKERSRRLSSIHAPYHDAVDSLLARRHSQRLSTILIAIHSYTPVFLGRARPWQVGILFDEDHRLADSLIRGLKAEAELNVGINEPYSPADQVYYTVGRHAKRWALPAAMIEIRNDEIGDETGQRLWAGRLAGLLRAARADLVGASHAMV